MLKMGWRTRGIPVLLIFLAMAVVECLAGEESGGVKNGREYERDGQYKQWSQ